VLMLRLVLKIFFAYWVAAGVVIVVSDFEPHREMHHPELEDALDSSLALNGLSLASAFENGRCSDAQRILQAQVDALALARADGTLLCGDTGVDGQQVLARTAAREHKRVTSNRTLFQLIATPLPFPNNSYVLLLKARYSRAFQIYGLLPGNTTVAISCVVTLFLAFLLALPIRKLRKAAQDIGAGNLATRVQWGKASETLHAFRGKDDIAKLVQDFNNMAARLQSLAEAQHVLLRDVSHELRSPLTRLAVGLGYARQEAPPAMSVHLNRIEGESKRLNDLIGQILALAHLETIQRVEVRREVSLSKVVVDLLPDAQYEAAQSGCTITTAITEGCTVKGNSELLRSAIENIVRNAIRHVETNGLIHIETAVIAENEKRIAVVRISDNGPGIPEDELLSVLKPFYRVKRPLPLQKAGFGIGLAIANRAAIVHGGTINIRNRNQGGLMVEICIPLSPGLNSMRRVARSKNVSR
jgi:two-component system sensor histidine kinase CpxA